MINIFKDFSTTVSHNKPNQDAEKLTVYLGKTQRRWPVLLPRYRIGWFGPSDSGRRKTERSSPWSHRRQNAVSNNSKIRTERKLWCFEEEKNFEEKRKIGFEKTKRKVIGLGWNGYYHWRYGNCQKTKTWKSCCLLKLLYRWWGKKLLKYLSREMIWVWYGDIAWGYLEIVSVKCSNLWKILVMGLQVLYAYDFGTPLRVGLFNSRIYGSKGKTHLKG